jgi:hypothetical protein
MVSGHVARPAKACRQKNGQAARCTRVTCPDMNDNPLAEDIHPCR